GGTGSSGPTGPTGPTGPQGPGGSGSLTGTANFVTKFTGTSASGNSQIFDNGTNIGIGTSSPSYPLQIIKAGSTRTVSIENSTAAGDALVGVNTAAVGTSTGAGVYGLTSQTGATAGVWGENSNTTGT